MRNVSGNPHMILGIALTASALGSALLLLDLKMNTGNTQGMTTGFGSRSTGETVSWNGGGASKAPIPDNPAFFSWPASDPAGAAAPPAKRGYTKDAAPRDRMAEESYYTGGDYGTDSGYSETSADMKLGGGGFSEGFYGGGGGGGSFSSYGDGPGTLEKKENPGVAGKSAGDKDGSAGRVKTKVPPPGLFGSPAIKNEHEAGRDLYASLKGNNAHVRSDLPTGIRTEDPWISGQEQKGVADFKSGNLEGMSGQSAALSLGGADESMSSASRNLPKSMKDAGGGASAGGSAPAPGAPAKTSGGGGDGGGSGGGGAGGAAADQNESAEADPEEAGSEAAGAEEGDSEDEDGISAASTDMLTTIAIEKRNGTGAKYLAGYAQEATTKPLLAELSHEAVAEDASNNPDSYMPLLSPPPAADPADPAELDSLSQIRVAEVKTEIHIFLARVETAYGQMTDIEQTDCADTPEVCTANGISGSYLTMTAGQRAKLTFGLKYVNDKWRRYVIDFTK